MAGNKTDNMTLPQSVVIQCPECGTGVQTVIYHQAKSMACPQCRSLFKYNAERSLFKQHVFKETTEQFTIPLNSRGSIQGEQYEVIGIQVKKEKRSNYEWREYLLFNPVYGYATLSEYNGHWNFLYQLNDYPRAIPVSRRKIEYEKKDFHLYNKYKTTLVYAQGEFYYDILREGDTKVKEFICPPFILLNEESGDEIRWFLGEYMTPSDIKSIFTLDTVPSRSGVGATQLMISDFKFERLLSLTVIFACILGVMQLFFSYGAAEKKILNKVYYKHNLNAEKVIVTEPFDLTDGTSALEFKVSSPLNNNWLDIDIELINDVTGEQYEAVKSLEFYSGYDDGAWTEGSQNESVIISSVPEGRYHLNITPDWGTQSNEWADPSFTLNVIHDVGLPSNFLWVLLIICIFPAIQYYRERNFETRRWMESDYSIDNS